VKRLGGTEGPKKEKVFSTKIRKIFAVGNYVKRGKKRYCGKKKKPQVGVGGEVVVRKALQKKIAGKKRGNPIILKG